MRGNSKYRRRGVGRAGLCGVGGEKPLRSVRQGSDRELLKAPLAAVQMKEIAGRPGKARTPPGSQRSVQAGGLESTDSGDISIPANI